MGGKYISRFEKDLRYEKSKKCFCKGSKNESTWYNDKYHGTKRTYSSNGNKSELKAAEENIKSIERIGLQQKILIVFDRGYPSVDKTPAGEEFAVLTSLSE